MRSSPNTLLIRFQIAGIYIALTFATLIAFFPVRKNAFVNLDDQIYIYNNYNILNGITIDNIKWAFTEGTHVSNYWHPLTWFSHMLDVQLFGLDAGGHHLSGLFFHILNTLILCFVFKQMTDSLWPSALLAALFALHPLHVESVAWASQRKDLLCALFWFISLFFYDRYTRNPTLANYLKVFTCLILGFMSKPMILTLPFVFFLLDYWPLNRLCPHKQPVHFCNSSPPLRSSRLLLEKVPFLAFIILASVVTYVTQDKGGALPAVSQFPIGARIENAILAYVLYIVKMLSPHDLAVFYPHYVNLIPKWQVVLAGMFLLLFSYLVLIRLRQYRYLTVGWLWYLGTLVPVIGLVQIGSFSMADRYTYIPMTGLFIMIAWGSCDLIRKFHRLKPAIIVSAIIVLTLFGKQTRTQVTYWKNSLTLYKHAYQVTPENPLTLAALGTACYDYGSLTDALSYLNQAIQLDPTYAGAHMQLGLIWSKLKRHDLALSHLTKAVQLDPKPLRLNNLAKAYMNMGNDDEALKNFKRALQLTPDDLLTNFNLGLFYQEVGNFDLAVQYYHKTLAIYPADWQTHNNLGVIYKTQGQYQRAIAHFLKTVQLHPDFIPARLMLDWILKNKATPTKKTNVVTEPPTNK